MRLMLAPIPNDGEVVPVECPRPTSNQPMDLQGALKQSVDLRFFFDRNITEEDIAGLSKKMKEIIEDVEFPLRHIGWVGLCSRDVVIVRNAVKKWLSIIPSRRGCSLSPDLTATVAPITPTSLLSQDLSK